MKTLFLGLLAGALVALLPLYAQQPSPPLEEQTRGVLSVWSDLDQKSGVHISIDARDWSMFLTESQTSRGEFRTAGIASPLLVLGPLVKRGTAGETFSARTALSAQTSAATEVDLHKTTLSNRSMGAAFRLKDRSMGLWGETGGEMTAGGLWLTFGQRDTALLATALTAARTKDPSIPGEWYPDKWDTPGGWRVNGAVTGSFHKGIFRGTGLMGLSTGEFLYPGTRFGWNLRCQKKGNHLMFRGGLLSDRYRSAGGHLPKYLAEGELMAQGNPVKTLYLSARLRYRLDRWYRSGLLCSAGLRWERPRMSLGTLWSYSVSENPEKSSLSGKLTLLVSQNRLKWGGLVEMDLSGKGSPELTVKPFLLLPAGNFRLTGEALWRSGTQRSLPLSASVIWTKERVTLKGAITGDPLDPDPLPELELSARVTF